MVRGLATQPEQYADENIDREVRHYLFRRGMDLRAIDIQRGRDHGLPTYNDFREVCGIKRAYSWDDYLDLISKEVFFFTEHIFMQSNHSHCFPFN
jgi:peroxidase